MNDRNLIAIVHELDNVTDDEISRYDREGAMILARELRRLSRELNNAATRLSKQVGDEGGKRRNYH